MISAHYNPALAAFVYTNGERHLLSKASWQNLAEVRESFRHADPVGDCTVFNIKGNDYRLITRIRYQAQKLFI